MTTTPCKRAETGTGQQDKETEKDKHRDQEIHNQYKHKGMQYT